MHPKTKKFSLYLMDLYGNRELIYTGKHNVWHAMPLKAAIQGLRSFPIRLHGLKIGPNQKPLKDGVLYSANVLKVRRCFPKTR